MTMPKTITSNDVSTSNVVSQLPFSSRNWMAISSSFKHALALDENGDAYSWGDNSKGQLGLDDPDLPKRTTPARIESLSGATDIATGFFTTFVIDKSGLLWGAGWSKYGALANGQVGDEPFPEYDSLGQLDAANALVGKWKKVSSKSYTGLGISNNGTLWGWGKNDLGAVGNGSSVNESTPKRIGGNILKWTAISAGVDICGAINENGDLFIWGNNDSGQCSVTQSATDNIVKNIAKVVFGNLTWTQVAAGQTHFLAVDSANRLWTWGTGTQGQLGLGSSTQVVTGQAMQIKFTEPYEKIIAIEAGLVNSAAIVEDSGGKRRLYVWGANGHGEVLAHQSTGQPIVWLPTSPEGSFDYTGWSAVQLGQQYTLALAPASD
jgi:alpha-tubulin suppressor-like RCC1 family protein